MLHKNNFYLYIFVSHEFESLNSYFESLNSYFESLNSYFESLNSYFESSNSYLQSLNSYFQSLNSYFQSLNSYFQSLNSYFETVVDKVIVILQLYIKNEFDIPSIIFERFAYLKWTPKAYMLKICLPPPPPQYFAKCPPPSLVKNMALNEGRFRASCTRKQNLP